MRYFVYFYMTNCTKDQEMYNTILYPFVALVLSAHAIVLQAKDKQPNVVFIMADDLGWTDLGVMGSDYYEDKSMEFYDLKNDRSETNDLAAARPEKREELWKKLSVWLKKTEAPILIQLNPDYRGYK